jgi:hypothetical protein
VSPQCSGLAVIAVRDKGQLLSVPNFEFDVMDQMAITASNGEGVLLWIQRDGFTI